MKVKNISKKIIGNGSFRLLPGESLDVSGKETWVKSYLASKSLEEVKEAKPAAAAKTARTEEAAAETAETKAAKARQKKAAE